MMDIDTAAKKHAADLMDKLTEKRCAHMSDLVEAFTRAMKEAMPKSPYPYMHTAMFPPAPAAANCAAPAIGKYTKWNNGTFPIAEDDGA